jgi:hypothetical protein
MKTTKIAFISLMAILFFSCNGQNSKNKVLSEANKDKSRSSFLTQADTTIKPKVNVKVNKRYDDKGNVIQFDSTYSYFYSSPNGTLHSTNDSVFNQFQSFFDKTYPNFFESQNKDIFFNDSLFKYDFFNNDYFLRRYQLNQNNFERLYKRMDSVKQNFMQHMYPNGYQKKDEIKNKK